MIHFDQSLVKNHLFHWPKNQNRKNKTKKPKPKDLNKTIFNELQSIPERKEIFVLH